MSNAMQTPVLVLNASFEPLHICGARRALTLVVKGVAHIQDDKGHEIHPGIMMPSVVRLHAYRRVPMRIQAVKRKNILVRDRHTCQYCGEVFVPAKLTLDHVVPRSRGGRNSWENLVACCLPCNRKKGNRTPEEAGMMLLRKPRPVTIHTARSILRSLGAEEEGWKKYLYFENTTPQQYGA